MSTTGSIRFIDSTFIWEIDNFPNKCKGIGDELISPHFQAGDIPLNKVKLNLSLYPFGDRPENENYLSLYLNCMFCTDDVAELEIFDSYCLWNDNTNGDQYHNIKSSKVKFDKTQTNWGYNQFLQRTGDALKNHLNLSEDSTLRIRCSITSSRYIDVCNPYEELRIHFKTLFLSENLSDVTIQVDNEKLKAHKVILSARSEVFSAMFIHNMTESNENIIKIEDFSCNVIKEILRFIYCGEVKQLDSLSKDLLIAADKYNLPSLKKICEQNLWKNLNTDNACDILTVSDLCNCDELKKAAIKFIIKNMKIFLDTEELKKISENSKLCYDIFREIDKN